MNVREDSDNSTKTRKRTAEREPDCSGANGGYITFNSLSSSNNLLTLMDASLCCSYDTFYSQINIFILNFNKIRV